MMRFVGALLLFAAVFFVPAAAHAWSDDGHKVACAIAWEDLTRTARGGVKIILGIDTKEQFAESCIWADEYSLENPESASWHFVPVRPRRRSVEIERDCREPDSCALIQIDRNIDLVRDGPADLDKSKALKFLIHLVADVHQPLHVAQKKGDFGAEISASFLGRSTNLHDVWDNELLVEYGVPWNDLSTLLHEAISSEQREVWTQSAPLAWANESLDIAMSNSTGYARYSSVVLGESYLKGNIEVVRERLSQAGVRIGHILNDLLD
tara:strand:- start:3701 stop:4498 length:798 start_codon:yes stop_codon:yes gene_type:complete